MLEWFYVSIYVIRLSGMFQLMVIIVENKWWSYIYTINMFYPMFIILCFIWCPPKTDISISSSTLLLVSTNMSSVKFEVIQYIHIYIVRHCYFYWDKNTSLIDFDQFEYKPQVYLNISSETVYVLVITWIWVMIEGVTRDSCNMRFVLYHISASILCFHNLLINVYTQISN